MLNDSHSNDAVTGQGNHKIPRAVFVNHSSEMGGAELALSRLLRTNRTWSATLVVPAARDGAPDAFAEVPSNVQVIRTGPSHAARGATGTSLFASVGLALRLLASAAILIKSRQVRHADVIVANTTRSSVYVAIAASLLRIPFVVHVRDLIEAGSIGATAAWLMRRVVLPRASAVIANSHASLATVEPWAGAARLVVLPSPAGIVKVNPETIDVPAKVRRVGMVARIDPWKGQHLLLRAFEAAFPSSSTQLIFYGAAAFGHEAYLQELKALAGELEISDRVDFAGHVEDVGAAINTLDICVQASLRAEPLGQNVLQYLASGRPTLVSGEGGPAEWVKDGENGLTFEPRDQHSLTAALVRLRDDWDLRRRLTRAAASTPALRDDEDLGSAIEDLLKELIDG